MKPKIKPYKTSSDHTSLEVLLSRVNQSLHLCYSSDFSTGPGNIKCVIAPLFEYKKLLHRLSQIPNVVFMTMEEFIESGPSSNIVRVAIRHDIDGDIVASHKMAEVENELGISTTHYVLHTAPYYGYVKKGVFHRHEEMAELYLSLQELGHEVGLHIDPLHIYQNWNIDGAQGLCEELEWLRQQGLRIVGTAAHNHTSIYGAQNYEIFKSRLRNHHMPCGTNAEIVDVSEVTHNGKWAPLHVLDMEELGIKYETHDTYAVPGYLGIMAEVGHGKISQTWNTKLSPTDRGLRTGIRDYATLDDALDKLRPGDGVVFTTHPCYYGARLNIHEPPFMQADVSRMKSNSKLGWVTWDPGSVVAVSQNDKKNDEQVSQSCNHANTLGFIDKEHETGESIHILILGGETLSPPERMVYDHLGCSLENELNAGNPSNRLLVRSAGFPHMAPSRYYAWLDHLTRDNCPPIVLLGVDPDLQGLWPDDWPLPDRKCTGSMFLEWQPDTDTVRVNKLKRRLRETPSTRGQTGESFSYLKACLHTCAELVVSRGGTPVLLLEPRSEKAPNSPPALTPEQFMQLADELELNGVTGTAETTASNNTAFDSILVSEQLRKLVDIDSFRASPKALTKSPASTPKQQDPPVATIINIKSISYTGTTWICGVLSSHPDCFFLGPPDRFFELWKDRPQDLCLVHGSTCEFWPQFCRNFDPDENFYVQLARTSGKKFIVINNPGAHELIQDLDDPRVSNKVIRVARDGRAVTASYERKMGTGYLKALEWYAPAAQWMGFGKHEDGILDLRYEDLATEPLPQLARLSAFLGMTYSKDALQYWNFDHHPISGNQGMFALMKLHLGLPIPNFESREYYEAQFASGLERQGRPVLDERWRDQLSDDDLAHFDVICGKVNADWGYQRNKIATDSDLHPAKLLEAKKACHRFRSSVVAYLRSVYRRIKS